jgi:hypothetical protein
MWRELGEVAQISTGYPFRGKVEHVPGGPLVVLQQKDISDMVAMPSEQPAGFAPVGAARLDEDDTYRSHLLKPGDVLLQARGTQFLSVVFLGNYPAIAAQGVAVFQPSPSLLPDFLHWYFSHPKTADSLRGMARGTHIPFLSKQTLTTMKVPVPGMETQRQVVATADVQRRYRVAAQRLLKLNDELIDAATWHAATQNK